VTCPAPACRRPRLLYIAFYFVPTRASGVHRSLATANHFARSGWDVTVLTVNEDYFRDYVQSWDPSLADAIDPTVHVERVRFPGWRHEPELRRYSWLRGHLPLLAERFHQRREQAVFPEPYASWIRPAWWRARALHARHRFDLTLATGNPHADFAVAWALARTNGLPYVVDYRDSWTLNLYDDAPAYPIGHPAHSWERRILERAALSVYVNEPLRAWHQQRYPDLADRMTVVANGWEPKLLGDVLTLRPHHERPVRFGYLGTLTERMPLAEFVAGWRLARVEPEMAGAVARLYGHLGYFASSAPLLRSVLPLDDDTGITYAGPVAKTEVAIAYDDMDVLLLILAGSRYVTSGKVYEYMATGKPIVSIHEPDVAAAQILRGYPRWYPVRDLTPESIRRALLEGAAAAQRATDADAARCRDYAAIHTRQAQLAPFEQQLRELVGVSAVPTVLR
jgi:glycosyltransferase involved in cell wall biosynthesis